MAAVTIDREFLYIQRGRVWKFEISATGVAAGASHLIGMTTGDRSVVIANRVYGATTSVLVAALYEVSFTGGSDPRYANRRLDMPASAELIPVTVKTGVTATPVTIITSATILAPSSTGNASIAFQGEGSAFILKANTSYVVALTNGGSGAADIGMAFDVRANESLRTINESD